MEPSSHGWPTTTTGARADRDAFRAELMARIPRYYSPWLHLAAPSLSGVVVIAAMIALLHDLRPLQLLTVPAVWLISNAVEWRVHKNVLHHRLRGFAVLHDRHTPEHHRVFVREDMAMRSVREFRLVLIPAYGVASIIVMDLPLFLGLWWLGHHNVAALFLATSAFYVVSYELLHLSYHLPETHPLGRLALVRVLRRHHATHHEPKLMQKWNFNVTVPLWDLVRGTIYKGELPLHADAAERAS
jgi:hypothetical protein